VGARRLHLMSLFGALGLVGALFTPLTIMGGAEATEQVQAAVEPAEADSWTFEYTGGPQEFTVPDGVTGVVIEAIGASGERVDAGALPGNGALTIAGFHATPGETLTVWVGGAGDSAGGWGFGCGGERGRAAIGSGRWGGDGGGGGGASAVTEATTTAGAGNCDPALRGSDEDWLTVAGGGGGGGGLGAVSDCVPPDTRCHWTTAEGGVGGDAGLPAAAGGPDVNGFGGGCGGCEPTPNGTEGDSAGPLHTLEGVGGSGGGGGGASGGDGGTEPLDTGSGGGGGSSFVSPGAIASLHRPGTGAADGSVTITAGSLELYDECTEEPATPTVPATSGAVHVIAQGGQGQFRGNGASGDPGLGGVTSATFLVVPGSTANVSVGCMGDGDGGWGVGLGGEHGTAGSVSADDGGGGGGGSSVSLVVPERGMSGGLTAGGGGGGGGADWNGDTGGRGGDGGLPPASGTTGSGIHHAEGGCGGCVASGDGEKGGHSTAIEGGGGGGGGGGGYLGGGGGHTAELESGSGAGGGSSWVGDTGYNTSFATAATGGDGIVQLLWLPFGFTEMSVFGGAKQSAEPGATFAEPLSALVTDYFGNPVSGRHVTFQLDEAGNDARFAGTDSTSAAVQTDAAGIAKSPLIVAGTPSNWWLATAQVEGNPEPLSYILSTLPYQTAVTATISPAPVTSTQENTIAVEVVATDTAAAVGGNAVIFVQGIQYPVEITNGKGEVRIPTGTLALGDSTATARYDGTPLLAPSIAEFALSVTPAATTTSLTSDLNPAHPGDPVTFRAEVHYPPGNEPCTGCAVVFADAGTILGTIPLDSDGVAVLGPVDSLSDGSHNMTATLEGSADYASSVGTLTQVVSLVPGTITVTTSPNPSTYNAPFLVRGTVALAAGGPAPTGGITAMEGGQNLCIVNELVDGRGSCTAPSGFGMPVTPGGTEVEVHYAGDLVYPPGTGTTQHLVVASPTSTSVTSASSTITAGESTRFTITVEAPDGYGGFPGGSVELLDNGIPIEGLGHIPVPTVSQDKAQATTEPVAFDSDGVHTITARFTNAPNWVASQGTTTLTVDKATTAVEVQAITDPLFVGEAAQYVASVTSESGRDVEGFVQFQVDGIDRGPQAALVGGVVSSEAVPGLGAGTHSVSARFLPALGFAPASDRIEHLIWQPSVTMLGASLNPVAGGELALRAHVGPQAHGGTLAFSIDGVPIPGCGALALVDSTADCLATAPGAGGHIVRAHYSGTEGLEASSDALNVQVTPPSSTKPASILARSGMESTGLWLGGLLLLILGACLLRVGNRHPS
jgi:hypothetical protein